MGIKEQVKTGQLTTAEALTRVAVGTKTHGWLKRRIAGLPSIMQKGGGK